MYLDEGEAARGRAGVEAEARMGARAGAGEGTGVEVEVVGGGGCGPNAMIATIAKGGDCVGVGVDVGVGARVGDGGGSEGEGAGSWQDAWVRRTLADGDAICLRALGSLGSSFIGSGEFDGCLAIGCLFACVAVEGEFGPLATALVAGRLKKKMTTIAITVITLTKISGEGDGPGTCSTAVKVLGEGGRELVGAGAGQ